MSDSTKDGMLADLERLIGEVDGLLRVGLGRAGEARESLIKIEKELEVQIRKRAQHADRYVHEKPWVAIGASAAVAFLLGCFATRRNPDK